MAKTSSLVTEAAPRCTACNSERVVKNGKNVYGHQQFRCGACRVLHPKSREATPERKEEVLRAAATERLIWHTPGRFSKKVLALIECVMENPTALIVALVATPQANQGKRLRLKTLPSGL